MSAPWDHHGRTHRLELTDAGVREWDATVLDVDEDGVVLDRSAFYAGGGGQPPDEGVLLWGGVRSRVVGVRKGDDLRLVLHPEDPVPPAGTSVRGALDDERRTALMRTHTAVHVLAGVVARDLAVPLTGGDMSPLAARVDLDLPDPPADLKERLTEALRAEVAADRSVVVSALPREEAYARGDIIRTATDLLPADL